MRRVRDGRRGKNAKAEPSVKISTPMGEDKQKTLGYLRDILSTLPADMPCRYDTGHNFGLQPVEYIQGHAWDDPRYGDPECDIAQSASAYPSCYRGYYADCTFNADLTYPISTVGHVLSLINGAIGKTFEGYHGGLYLFEDGTLVWGGGTSHGNSSDCLMVIGVEVVDGVCILKTEQETLWKN